MNKIVLAVNIFCVAGGLLTACTDHAKTEKPVETTPEVVKKQTEPVPTGTFSEFLDQFESVTTWENWPEDGIGPLVTTGAIWNEPAVTPILEKSFRKMPDHLTPFVPVEAIRQFDSLETPVEDPYKSFDFYAFRKIEKEFGILVSIFALKLDPDYQGEFFAHPFYLASFSPDGKLIDTYVWMQIVDDMWEGANDIAVDGETLLVGRKVSPGDANLKETWEKTRLTPEGKFDTFFSQFPESEL